MYRFQERKGVKAYLYSGRASTHTHGLHFIQAIANALSEERHASIWPMSKAGMSGLSPAEALLVGQSREGEISLGQHVTYISCISCQEHLIAMASREFRPCSTGWN